MMGSGPTAFGRQLRRGFRGVLALSAGALLFAASGIARANSNKLTVETVSAYDSCPGWPNLDSDADGNGFLSGMEPSGNNTWTTLNHFWDNGVYDTDFLDPDLLGNPAENDTYNFDSADTGIAWYTGHGGPPWGWYGGGGGGEPNPPQPCTSGYDCTNCPCDSQGRCLTVPSECQNQGPTQHNCIYTVPSLLHTCSSGDSHNDVADLTDSACWGESSDAGGWRGCGTNGGANMAIVTASTTVAPGLYTSMLGPIFAGLHILAVVMPVSGDTLIVSDRGSTFAGIWQASYDANYQSDNKMDNSPAQAWLEMASQVPAGEGTACPFDNYSGGGHGINSCGAYVVMSVDKDASTADWHLDTEGWLGLQWDANDATGDAGTAVETACNYDCNAHPFTLGLVNTQTSATCGISR